MFLPVLHTMGKKPRSQRRKKGSALGEQADDVDVGDVDLPEDHTVADSFSTYGEDFGTTIGYSVCVCVCVFRSVYACRVRNGHLTNTHTLSISSLYRT